ncbi:MAG: DEAD/DEAH box helicase [Oscillospiraceae bacterium]|nr:DEAD/DEAH box helicase [Oscillospiraceae bacterium]
MTRERFDRPDGKIVKSMMETATRIDGRLRDVVGQEVGQRRCAQDAAQALFDERVRSALEEMDVEHINKGKQGIRIQLLRDAGFLNVYQVSGLSFQRLCAIDGLGERSAEKILGIVREITKNTKETIRIRIQVEQPGKTDEDLIRALYVLIHARQPRQVCRAIYEAAHGPLQQELALAKQSLGGFGWIFKSKTKKDEILTGVERLEARLKGPFGDGVALGDYEKVLAVTSEVYWKDYIQNASAYYAELEQLGISWEKQDGTPGGLPAQLAAEIEQQALDLKYLKATLRSYQTFGTKYIVHQKKSLLGDEMGLGKTIQAIAAMAAQKAAGQHHFMVVCPASVLVNWCREIQKHSTLEVTKVHGNDEASLLHWRENGDVAVTTYESISRFSLPEKFKIGMIVVDEAHYVKNPDTIRTKALQKLLKQTQNVLFMSGTPLENRVEEMCFLVSCLQPELAKELERVSSLSTAEQFRQQLAPVYLRRTRDDVLQELPELTEKEQWCVLGKQEQADYREAVLSGNFMAIRQVSWQVDDLKQSSKAARLLELCDQAREQKRKVIVFSFFRNTLRKVTELLGERCMEPVTGDISPQRRQEIVDEFSQAEDGAVLVSQVQAGGTGLNIQSASVIIFCEPQIKPSIENQAISRAYRMGQVRDVLVYRLLADDTIDEQMLEILKVKQEQFDHFADESVVGEESLKPSEQAWIARMVEEEKKRLLEKE